MTGPRDDAAAKWEKAADAGWAWPKANARRVHYFDGGRSLCSKWLYFGKVHPPGAFSPYELCKGCQGKLS